MQRLISPDKTFGFGKLTQSAGTAIVRTANPVGGTSRRNLKTRINKIVYTAGATAHTLTIMRELGTTTLSSAAASGQAVINLTANPGTNTPAGGIAANDYVVIKLSDGTYQTAVVSSVSTLAVTLTGNVDSPGAAAGAKVWFMGAPGDHTNTFALASGATTTLDGSTLGRTELGFIEATVGYSPLIAYINNASNAGTLQQMSGCWSKL